MFDYMAILKNLFKGYEPMLEKALSGDVSDCTYSMAESTICGVFDGNQKNRLKLSYSILYTVEHSGDSRLSNLAVALFNEEVKARQNDSFQGIGSCLEVLTFLLNKFNVPNRNKLFEQAKNANFDCACGYFPDNVEVFETIDSLTLEDAINLLIEIGENKLAKQFCSEFLSSMSIVDENSLSNYKLWMKWLGDKDAEITAAEKLLSMSILTDDAFDISSRYIDYITLLNAANRFEEAAQSFDCLIGHIITLDNWYKIGLGRMALEQCMDIVLNFEPKARELWEWAEPFLRKIIDNMHGNLYQKASTAALKMGEFALAEILDNKYDELMLY